MLFDNPSYENLPFGEMCEYYLPVLGRDLHSVFDEVCLPTELDRACRYSLDAGGKRLRPLLVMTAFVAFGGLRLYSSYSGMARRAAVAVELLHCYSLIHDDLPCMDDDVLRRGRPTCHIEFGEDVALLAGDALQSLSFESLSLTTETLRADDLVLSARLSEIFAPRARRMVAGQMRDVLGENKTLSQAELEKIHTDKTGALIEAALLMGAVCAKVSHETLEQVAQYAKLLGLAFQVQDDVLDVIGDTKTLGKPVGSDEKLNKSTYVKLLGQDKAWSYAQELFAKARAVADGFLPAYPRAVLFGELIDWVEKRQS